MGFSKIAQYGHTGSNMKRTQQNIRKGQIYKSRFASLWVTYIEVTKLDGCIQLAN